MGFENMFDDHLVRKQAFIDWKILILCSGHIGIFPKGLNHDFGKKNGNSSLFVFWHTRPENKVWWLSSTKTTNDFGQPNF